MPKTIHSSEYKTIIEKLRKAREKTGLTQQEVAEKLDKPQSYISKIERGERRIDVVELAELARMYKKRASYFLEES